MKIQGIKKKTICVSEICFLLYFVAYAIRYYTNMHLIVSILLIFAFVVIAFFYAYAKTKSSTVKKFMVGTIMVDIIACIAVLVNSNHTVLDVLLLIAWQTMGFALYTFHKHFSTVNKMALMMTVVLILLEMNMIAHHGFDFDTIPLTVRMSRNTISILLIQYFSINTMCRQLNDRNPNYFYLIVICVASAIVGGAGNFAVSAFLFLSFVYIKIMGGRNRTLKKLVLFALCLDANAFVIDIFIQAWEYVMLGDYSSRFYIWEEYVRIAQDTLSAIFFGANISSHEILSLYGNMHNTLLNWHYYFGLVPMLYSVYISILSIVGAIRNKQRVYIALMSAMILRSITDDTIFSFTQLWIYFACQALDTRDKRINQMKE